MKKENELLLAKIMAGSRLSKITEVTSYRETDEAHTNKGSDGDNDMVKLQQQE